MQFGFTIGKETLVKGCNIHSQADAGKALGNRKKLYYAFVDLAKAFDRRPRKKQVGKEERGNSHEALFSGWGSFFFNFIPNVLSETNQIWIISSISIDRGMLKIWFCVSHGS